MSVVAYLCQYCGVQHECDVADSGERLCPDCGKGVTGITKQETFTGPQFSASSHPNLGFSSLESLERRLL